MRAVYVHPRAGRQGVGALIIRELERRAIVRQVPSLELVASLNAVEFYRREGYEVLSHGSHRLANGQEMPRVQMRKSLKAP